VQIPKIKKDRCKTVEKNQGIIKCKSDTKLQCTINNIDRVMNTDKFQIARNAILNENMD